jgi:SAM-dependent methyltransferase
MTDPINVQEIMAEVRARIEKRAAPLGPPPRSPSVDWVRLEGCIKALESASSRIGELPPQPPTFRGRIGSFIVKLVRRALFWYTPQVLEFQIATTRVIEEVIAAIKMAVETGQRRWRAMEALSEQLVELRAETERLRDEIGVASEQIESQFESRRTTESRLTDVTQALNALRDKLDSEVASRAAALGSLNTRLDSEIANRETFSRDTNTRSESIAAEMRETEVRLLHLRAEVINQNRRISILLEESRKRLPEPFNETQLLNMAAEEKHALDAMYVSFEDRFRGTRAEIKESFRIYLPYLKGRTIGTKQMPVVDIGCGRGEWLELLRENELEARGVDLNHLLLTQCKEMGLEVIEDDAMRYLRNLSDSSVGAVTGFHIIEHLPIDILVKVIDETVRVLKPGGIAIFETPNPGNVLVGTHNFYLDFTHRNPLPSQTVQFLLEARGLCDVQILDLHPYPKSLQLKDDGTEVTKRFNEYFYGAQDYAVIGRRI